MTQNYTTVVGESAATAAAYDKIERLTTAHDTVCGALATAIKRAEKAEAERDAIAAAAFEAATSICADQFAAHMTAAIYGDPDNSRAREASAAMAERLLHRIRRLTPADAKAALEAYGREKMRAGMQMAAELIAGEAHVRSEFIQPAAPHAAGVLSRAYDAILAEMEKLK